MSEGADLILATLDRCCDNFTFPMLDNGYVYLAATRLSLFRSPDDWALVIEVFGFSPRSGSPDTHIHTFASRLHDRDPPEKYRTRAAFDNYIAQHPHQDSRFVFPFGEIDWCDEEECVAKDVAEVVLRGRAARLPGLDEYGRFGIQLEESGRVRVFEACRYFAEIARDQVLATPDERRISVRPDMQQVIQLEDWHHPDVVDENCRPSGSRTFQELARVLATGDVRCYTAADPPNTHWRNWPDGGTL